MPNRSWWFVHVQSVPRANAIGGTADQQWSCDAERRPIAVAMAYAAAATAGCNATTAAATTTAVDAAWKWWHGRFGICVWWHAAAWSFPAGLVLRCHGRVWVRYAAHARSADLACRPAIRNATRGRPSCRWPNAVRRPAWSTHAAAAAVWHGAPSPYHALRGTTASPTTWHAVRSWATAATRGHADANAPTDARAAICP